MKILNIKQILFKPLLISMMLMAAGCSEDFIDLAPVSSQNVESFFANSDDLEYAITGLYAALQQDGMYGNSMPIMGELRSDNAEMGSTASSRASYYDLSEFNTQPTFSLFEDTWDDHYVTISRANLILARIGGIQGISDSYRERVRGECRFLRALCYFNLVRVFGPVPLVTSELTTVQEAYEYGRNATDEIYAQIIEDFQFAEEVLPETVANNQMGRATSGAASALLGKVYLTTHNYQAARDKLREVINSGTYSLLDDYADLWNSGLENHEESIFDIQWQANGTYGTGSAYSERFYPYNYTNFGFSTASGGYNIPTVDLINSYEDGDLRKGLSVQESWMNGEDEITGLEGRYGTKFIDPPTNGSGADDNWPVIRYGDVLLMYAEALNEISFQANGEAFSYLNLIRRRAGLDDKTAGNTDPALSVDNQEEFRLAMEQERRAELALEGHRWFDLVRTGRAIEVMSGKVSRGVQEYQLLFPVPQSQIDVNPGRIQQNPEY